MVRSIPKCHEIIYEKTEITEDELKQCTLFIHEYGKIIYDYVGVNINSEIQHDLITEKLYQSYLNMIIEMSENDQLQDELEDLFYETMEEFQEDESAAKNTIILISGYANGHNDTRINKITQFVNKIYNS